MNAKNDLLGDFIQTALYTACLKKVEIGESQTALVLNEEGRFWRVPSTRQFDNDHDVLYRWENDDFQAQLHSSVYLRSVLSVDGNKLKVASANNLVACAESWGVRWANSTAPLLYISDKQTGVVYDYNEQDFNQACQCCGLDEWEVRLSLVADFINNDLLAFQFDVQEAYRKEIQQPIEKVQQLKTLLNELNGEQKFPVVLKRIEDTEGFVFSADLMLGDEPVAVIVKDQWEGGVPSIEFDKSSWHKHLTHGVGVCDGSANRRFDPDGSFENLFQHYFGRGSQRVEFVQSEAVHLLTDEERLQKQANALKDFEKALKDDNFVKQSFVEVSQNEFNWVFRTDRYRLSFPVKGVLSVEGQGLNIHIKLSQWQFAQVQDGKVEGVLAYVQGEGERTHLYQSQSCTVDEEWLKPVLAQSILTHFDPEYRYNFDIRVRYPSARMESLNQALNSLIQQDGICRAEVNIHENKQLFDDTHRFDIEIVRSQNGVDRRWLLGDFWANTRVQVDRPDEQFYRLHDLLGDWHMDESVLRKWCCHKKSVPKVLQEQFSQLNQQMSEFLCGVVRNPYVKIQTENDWFESALIKVLAENRERTQTQQLQQPTSGLGLK